MICHFLVIVLKEVQEETKRLLLKKHEIPDHAIEGSQYNDKRMDVNITLLP